MLGFLVRSGVLVCVTYAVGGGLAALFVFGLHLVVEFVSHAYLRVMDKLNELAWKQDFLFKNAEQTLGRAIDVHHAVEFLPTAVDRIECKLSGIEFRLERIVPDLD